MAVKFFGQFLIDQGEVDASQVREALDLMEDENATIGEIANREGYLTAVQASSVSAEQRTRDLSFGDLAVEMGFMQPQELVRTLQIQRECRLPIGEALARLGHLQSDRLGTLLDQYKTDQAQYEASDMMLPDGLANHRVTPYVLELLPKFLMRVARLQAKVGDIRPFGGALSFDEVRVSVTLNGVRGLEVALVADLEFASALAAAASGFEVDDLDPEMVADGVGEFLNVLAGNAAGALTKKGQRVELGPPDYDAEISDGWIVDLAVGKGNAALVLSVF